MPPQPEGHEGVAASYCVRAPPRCYRIAFVALPCLTLARPSCAAAPHYSDRLLDEIFRIIEESGLEKHGRLRDHLKEKLGMGHGDANTVVHAYRQRGDDAPRTVEGELARIYSGKEDLRPIHDAIMERVEGLGDLEISVKKSYVSLRRKKQFAMVGPATSSEVEIGLDFEHADPPERLRPARDGRKCRYEVRISDVDEVDDELIGWMRDAYESAG